MSSVYSGCAKIVLISGVSAVVYLSAGMALYYFYKKRRNREKKHRSPRKSQQELHGKKLGKDRSVSSSSISDCGIGESSGSSDDLRNYAEEKSNRKDKKGISVVNNNNVRAKKKLITGQEIDDEIGTNVKLISKETSAVQQEQSENYTPIQQAIQDQPDEIDSPKNDDVSHDDDSQNETMSEHNFKENSAAKDSTVDAAAEIVCSSSSFYCENGVDGNSSSNFNNSTLLLNHSCDGEVSHVMMNQQRQPENNELSQLNFTKKQTTDSPSVASDGRSETSQDSGKGQSVGLTSSMSPVDEELIEVPPMYEFEVPQDIVGLLIGRKGTTIKYFTDESGAHIVIRHHYYSDKHKICTIEGTREQINKCLRLIRYKFPPSRFPDLKLTPLLPPPVVSPYSPILDTVVNLSLPEGVRCEVVLSSFVDAGHFFVQQPTHPTFPSLARLDQYMLAVYNQPAGVPGLPRPIEVGIICAAPVMAGWYRAQTICVYEETDEVLVKFVDYGGYCKISATDLKQIRSDFMSLPFEAVECGLAHVKPIDEKEGWSREANELFENNVHGRVAEAYLVGRNDSSVSMVELYCTIGTETVMINQLLVDKGYATRIDDNCIIGNNAK